MTATSSKTVLNVGCGPAANPLPPDFRGPEWRQIRLDIDPSVEPDILASMTDMSAIETASIDAVWSSHNLEHLYPHEVPIALAEFCRILKPNGVALIACPDMQRVAELVAQDKLDEPVFESPAGPIAPIDMIYGWRVALASGSHFMAHRTGFTARTLGRALLRAGFANAGVWRDDAFNVWARGYKSYPARP